MIDVSTPGCASVALDEALFACLQSTYFEPLRLRTGVVVDLYASSRAGAAALPIIATLARQLADAIDADGGDLHGSLGTQIAPVRKVLTATVGAALAATFLRALADLADTAAVRRQELRFDGD